MNASDVTSAATTPQQADLHESCNEFLNLLDDLVPTNVAHWAVEDARRAVQRLADNADTVHTHDTAVTS